MPVGQIELIFDLELEIIQKGRSISVEEARRFQSSLISCRDKFLVYCKEDRCLDKDVERLRYNFERARCAQKTISRLLKHLTKIIESVESTSSTDSNSKVNDRSANDPSVASVNLNSLLLEQNYYIQMIDWLTPKGEISSREAEIEYDLVTQFYKNFTHNQSKITALVKDDALDEQMNVSKEMHRKIQSLLKTLKNIFSPIETPALFLKSKKNERNRIERPNYIANFLGSQCKKPEFPVKKTVSSESESKSNVLSNGTEHVNGVADSSNSPPELIKPESPGEQQQIESNGDLFAKEEMLQDEPSSSVENQTKKASEAGSSSTTLPTVEEVCSSFGLNDLKIEYTEADFQNLITYKSFCQHVRPILAQENLRASNGKLSMLIAAKWREFFRQNPFIKQAKSEVNKDPDYAPRATRSRTPKFRRSAEIYEYEEEKPNPRKSRSSSDKKKTTKKNSSNVKVSPYRIVLGKRTHDGSSDEDIDRSLVKHVQVLVPMLNLEQS